ncbi:MAG: thioredoxin fold domain-containing protein [Gammaproteobacteria bacterium]|nr:thioredoxin fold domain-containing protein [Gammaproteobacteria bacterium]
MRRLSPLAPLLLLLALLAPLFVADALAEEARDPYRHFFNDSFFNFQEELETAREQGKKGIMLFFEMDECPFCHRMKQQVLNQPQVQDWFRQHFLLFPVDIEGDIEVVDFQGNETIQKDLALKQYRVRATPVIAFFDLEGKLLHKYTGATSSVEEFLWLGEFVADGHYSSTNFTRFKQAKREAAKPAPNQN